MKKILIVSIISLISFGAYSQTSVHPQTVNQSPSTEKVNLHQLTFIDYIKDKKRFAFVSVTEDLLAHGDKSIEAFFLIPDEERTHSDPVNAQYSKPYYSIDGRYHDIFLGKIGLPNSSIFIYDKATKQSVSFDIKDLKISAVIKPNQNQGPYFESDYLYGFEIDADKVNNFEQPLVYIGEQNPFIQ